MPLGKYYCDYCDKEFQDTPVARKRHLQSTSHLRNKSLWYAAAAAAATPTPVLCNRFLNTGFCPNADSSCNYSHSLLNNNTRSSSSNNNNNNIDNNYVCATATGGIVRDMVGMSMGNLPPSLRPPPQGGGYPTVTLPFVDWG